jgi:choline dehydrogenase-like flavoprotein
MFFQARQVDEQSILRSTICIIGGGAAGITLALEFERQGVDTIVLESGGFKPDAATRDLYRGENAGLPYVFADGCRGRFLGGSSNCWGGWCGPLQEHDMAKRDWVPDSGWPFDRRTLDPYYERAHEVLQLGPYDYDVGRWVAKIDRHDVRRLPFVSGKVRDTLSQFSSPGRLGTVYRNQLAGAKHVRVCLHANVTDIETDATARTVRRLRVATLGGRRFTVEARQFVLACGGIENARLLLASNKSCAAGLGNGHDLVGRYFADHPRLALGVVRLQPQWRRNMLYDIKFHYLNQAMSVDGKFFSSQLSLAPEVQKQEGILNAQIWFNSIFPGEGSAAATALLRFKHLWHGKADLELAHFADVLRLARQPISTAGFVATRLIKPERLMGDVQVAVICEPAPNRDSRVTLSDTRDALGLPRVRVDWRLGEQVKRTFDRTIAVFADELVQAGVGDVEKAAPLEGRPWPEGPNHSWHHLGTWHHMGTTRMHDSPTQGVVDRNCRIHGMSNLYVAGSSVFPSFGANFPTTTIVALSLRMADHLAAGLAKPVAAEIGSVAKTEAARRFAVDSLVGSVRLSPIP